MALAHTILKATTKPSRLIRLVGNATQSFVSGKKAPTLPYRLQIENGNICNLRCTMCALNVMKRKKGMMNLEKFKEVFDTIKPAYVNLTGYSEMVLNKDIFDIIKYVKSKNAYVKIDSNATLTTEEKANSIINSGIDLISISIDGATKETYEKIRIPAKFEVVIENLKKLVRIRNEKKSKTQIHIAFVCQLSNFHELPLIIKLADQLGVDQLNSPFVTEYDIKMNEKYKLDKADFEKLKNIYNEALEVCKKVKVKTNIESVGYYLKKIESGEIFKMDDAHCYLPWYSAYITWEGDVLPCCYYYDGQVNFGNVFQKPFKEIWHSEEYQKFREQLAKEKTGICATCGYRDDYLQEKFSKVAKFIPITRLLSKRKSF